MARKLFDYLASTEFEDTRTNILDVPEEPAWATISELQVTPPTGSKYLIIISSTFTLADINDSALVQFSVDGGLNWELFSREAKDKTDRQALTYVFPRDMDGSEFHIIIQASKTTGAAQMDMLFSNLVMQRIG